MKIQLNKTLAVAVLGLVGSVFSVNSQAAVVDVHGSAGINNSGVQLLLGNDLAGNLTMKVFDLTIALVGNTGDLFPFDLKPLADRTLVSGALPFDIVISGTSVSVSSFHIPAGNGLFGSFNAQSAQIVGPRSSNFLDIFVKGDYTPGTLTGTQAGGCNTGGNTCGTTEASMRWSFNLSGASVTGSSTFNMPALSVPEPATLGLMGLGLAGFAAARKKQLA